MPISPILKFTVGIALFAGAALVYWATLNWSEWMVYITTQQRELHTMLSEHMTNVAENPAKYGFALITLSFLYGVFHAIGPGHGKAVIMTYVGTQGASVKKGALLSFAAAMLQSLVAVVLVSVFGRLLEIGFGQVQDLGEQITLVGYALVISLGIFILFKAGRKLWRTLQGRRHSGHEHHFHSLKHDHQHGSNCGCSHTVEAKAEASWLQNLTLVFSMGLRPCSGALIVLTYAYLVDAYTFGIAATFAMGFGTGMSIALIAAGTVLARSFFERMVASPDHTSSSHFISNGGLYLQVFGGALLILFGWGLLSTALQTAVEHPLKLGG